MAARITKRERLERSFRSQEVDRFPVSPRIWAWLLGNHQKHRTPSTETDFVERFPLHHPVPVQCMAPRKSFRDVHQDLSDVPDISVSVEEIESGRVKKVRRTISTPAGELEEIVLIPPSGEEYGVGPDQEKLEPLVKTEKDIEAACFLVSALGEPDYDAFLRSAEELGDEGLLLFSDGFASPSHCLVDAMRLDGAMVLFMDAPDSVLSFVEAVNEYWLGIFRKAIDRGVRYIDLNCYNASLSAGWSPAQWRTLFLPYAKQAADMVHEAGGVCSLYDDGRITGNLDNLRDTGVDCIYTVAPGPDVGDADVAEVRRALGGKVCLWGGVDLQIVLRGTPEEVRAEVRRVVDGASAGREGGFILGASDSIRDGSPIENVEAFYDEAARLQT